MMKRKAYNPLKNQRGLLTLDFIFSAVLVFTFSAIMFSFAITLSVVEVVQYMSFAAARSYSLGHVNEAAQRRAGEEKFLSLRNQGSVLPLLNSGWFVIGNANIGDFNDDLAVGNDLGLDSRLFVGARVPFSAPILYKRVPLLGATASNPDGFQANISSFLAREPTAEECQAFANERLTQLINNGGYGAPANNLQVITDNGC